MSGEWMAKAACRGTDTNLFYPSWPTGPRGPNLVTAERAAAIDALAVCETCPVRAECLADNLRDPWGVFGGTVPAERWRRARAQRPRDSEKLKDRPGACPKCGSPRHQPQNRGEETVLCTSCWRQRRAEQNAAYKKHQLERDALAKCRSLEEAS